MPSYRNLLHSGLLTVFLIGQQSTHVIAAAPKGGAAPGVQVPASNSHEAEIRALLQRQIEIFQKGDASIAAGDWLPDAVVISPEGSMPAKELPAACKDYVKHFRDLQVTITHMVVSDDGTEVAAEWDWDVTRKRDGARSVTHEAIFADLDGGKIKGWREYWDLNKSVEAKP